MVPTVLAFGRLGLVESAAVPGQDPTDDQQGDRDHQG